MAEKFLKARHWQLFMLLCGVPLLYQILLIGSIQTASNILDSHSFFHVLFGFYPIVLIVLMITYLGWIWAIGTGLQTQIPEELRQNTRRFEILLAVPAVYITLVSLLLVLAQQDILDTSQTTPPAWVALILPAHLIAMACIFYGMYFAARTIALAEKKRAVRFADFAGEFFMIWFFPIGVWLLQPEVNRLAEGRDYTQEEKRRLY